MKGNTQRGVALILVLWTITLLSVIAGNFSFSMRSEAQITRNMLSSAQARAVADGGVQRAKLELIKPASDPQRWQSNGLAHTLTLAGAELRVTLSDESGKIDLNTASDALLKGLFVSVGLNDDAATNLLDAILDWRDPDNIRRLHGAEERDYFTAGKSYTPSNAPFETVDELLRVLGMTFELYRKLAPALTVHSRQQGINTPVAEKSTLLAIPGMSPAMLEQYVVQRQLLLSAGQKVPDLSGAGPFHSGASGMTTYSVRSEARLPDGTVFVRVAVIRLTQDSKRPFMTLAWEDGEVEQMMQK